MVIDTTVRTTTGFISIPAAMQTRDKDEKFSFFLLFSLKVICFDIRPDIYITKTKDKSINTIQADIDLFFRLRLFMVIILDMSDNGIALQLRNMTDKEFHLFEEDHHT